MHQMTQSQPSPLAELVTTLTSKDDEQRTEYFAALGEFLVEYAAAEIAMHELARKLSGMSDEKARIVFHKMHRGTLANKIIDLCLHDELRNDQTLKAMLADCFAHLNLISENRDILAHRAVSFESVVLFGIPHLKATNETTAKRQTDTETNIYQLVDLKDMTNDCRVIGLRLFYAAHFDVLSKGSGDRDFLQLKWSYKGKTAQQKKSSKRKLTIADLIPDAY